MSVFELKIKKHNQQVYADVLQDIMKQKNGSFQFTLTINQGSIVDYVSTQLVDYRRGFTARTTSVRISSTLRTRG